MRSLKILFVTINWLISASCGMDLPATQTDYNQRLIFCLSIMKNIRFYDEIFNRLCQPNQNTIQNSKIKLDSKNEEEGT